MKIGTSGQFTFKCDSLHAQEAIDSLLRHELSPYVIMEKEQGTEEDKCMSRIHAL